jgi:hypothetical protein
MKPTRIFSFVPRAARTFGVPMAFSPKLIAAAVVVEFCKNLRRVVLSSLAFIDGLHEFLSFLSSDIVQLIFSVYVLLHIPSYPRALSVFVHLPGGC